MAFALGKSTSTASAMYSVASAFSIDRKRESKHEAKHEESQLAPRLTMWRKLAYGVGHVLNDLFAAMWFTYTLIFFNKVLLFSSSSAGVIILIGQIADGLATPFVGYFSDRSGNLWICKYGRRKTWHLVGTICEMASFPFIFTPCLSCQHSEQWVHMVYYSTFVIIFQFGWAAVQISHLSLVPELTPDEYERTLLLALRYSFTVMSSMVVYIVLWVVLQVSSGDSEAPITPKDTAKFQMVAYVVLALGCIMTIVFHAGTREMSQGAILLHDELGNASQSSKPTSSTWGLFGKVRLYQIAMLYMMTRLFANISQSIFPMYLHDVLFMGGDGIAMLPLVMYALSFAMSALVKPLNKRCGRKVAFCFGAAIGIGVSVWVRLGGEGHIYKTYSIYIVAGLYGVAASALLVTSLALTADMIGQDLSNGAFIYGLMSFFDKLSNGVVVMMIQTWTCWPTCAMHYRDSLAYVCGGAAVLGAVAVLTLYNTPSTEGVEEKREENSRDSETLVYT